MEKKLFLDERNNRSLSINNSYLIVNHQVPAQYQEKITLLKLNKNIADLSDKQCARQGKESESCRHSFTQFLLKEPTRTLPVE